MCGLVSDEVYQCTIGQPVEIYDRFIAFAFRRRKWKKPKMKCRKRGRFSCLNFRYNGGDLKGCDIAGFSLGCLGYPSEGKSNFGDVDAHNDLFKLKERRIAS